LAEVKEAAACHFEEELKGGPSQRAHSGTS
jgi:hypothetical protein